MISSLRLMMSDMIFISRPVLSSLGRHVKPLPALQKDGDDLFFYQLDDKSGPMVPTVFPNSIVGGIDVIFRTGSTDHCLD